MYSYKCSLEGGEGFVDRGEAVFVTNHYFIGIGAIAYVPFLGLERKAIDGIY